MTRQQNIDDKKENIDYKKISIKANSHNLEFVERLKEDIEQSKKVITIKTLEIIEELTLERNGASTVKEGMIIGALIRKHRNDLLVYKPSTFKSQTQDV